jgi:hypothetical protein
MRYAVISEEFSGLRDWVDMSVASFRLADDATRFCKNLPFPAYVVDRLTNEVVK